MGVRRATPIAVLAAFCLIAPATAAAAQQPSGTSLDDAGRLTVNFEVDRFVVRNGRLAARGTAVATLSGAGTATRTVRKRVTAPARVAQSGRRRCALISLSLAPLQLDLLGLRVQTSTSTCASAGYAAAAAAASSGGCCARWPAVASTRVRPRRARLLGRSTRPCPGEGCEPSARRPSCSRRR